MITPDPAPANLGRLRGAGHAPLVEAMPPSLLDEPLACIFADHFRQRTICSALRRSAMAGKADRKEAETIAAFAPLDRPFHGRCAMDDGAELACGERPT
jgi:hypothetical protein